MKQPSWFAVWCSCSGLVACTGGAAPGTSVAGNGQDLVARPAAAAGTGAPSPAAAAAAHSAADRERSQARIDLQNGGMQASPGQGDAALDVTVSADAGHGAPLPAGPAIDSDALKRNFAEYRFGMFLHFGMNTFSNDAARDLPNQDPALFNPTNLDPGQWIDAAVAAKMKFVVLTTKHHDGFLLWDSATTDYDVGNPAVPSVGRQDVVKLFVDACRARGVAPALYYSVQDRSKPGLGTSGWSVSNERMPRELIDFVKAQIKELLTNYGFIPFFVIDGWAWSMGHTIMPYQELREYMYELSPNTLFTDHQGQEIPWHVDAVYYEEPKGAWSPDGNILASWQSQRMGHAWFWTPPDAGYAGPDVANYITTHLADLEPKYTNYAPDFGPNRQGLLEDVVVERLRAVGAAWSPNLSRPPLPTQPPNLEHALTAVAAIASSTAAASISRSAVDGINDGGFTDHYTETVWQSASGAPQSLTIDLGRPYAGIDMLTYQPPQIAPRQVIRDTSGRITTYRISFSLDGTTFSPVILEAGYDGRWQWSDTEWTGWRWAEFHAVTARYVKLEALSATGNVVQINEVDVGGRQVAPVAR